MDRLREIHVWPSSIVGQGVGGLLIERMQEVLLSLNSSLYMDYRIRRIMLLNPAPPQGLPSSYFDNPLTLTLVRQYQSYQLTLGEVVSIPEPDWIRIMFSSLSGVLHPNAPKPADVGRFGYTAAEPYTAIMELVNGFRRPMVREGAFGPWNKTLLQLISYDNNMILPPQEAKILYEYLTGDTTDGRLVSVEGPDTVPDLHQVGAVRLMNTIDPSKIMPLPCPEMVAQTVPASAIGLPTGGAVVTSATLIKATDAGNTSGEYCRILGKVKPGPTAAANTPDINFQLNLPTNWNGRSAHFGGGGFNGVVIPANAAIAFAPGYIPLALGLATFGSDSGHVGGTAAATALNEETIYNFGYGHIKKMHDTAFELIRLRYTRIPSKSYFVGSSTGGREGMAAIQRYPKDYDGVISMAPAINYSGVRMHGVKIGQAAYSPGGFINPAKQKLIYKTAVDACDRDDGAADRIISDVAGCRNRTDAILANLRCASGKDEGDSCLSDTQMQTLKVISDDLVWPYKLAYGVIRHQGYNILQGADFSHATNGLGSSASAINPPTNAVNGRLFTTGDAYFKSFIVKNEKYDSLLFDLNNPGPFLQRMIELSDVVGAMNPDIEAFRARGGKLIMMHGLADEIINPNVSIAYYEDQVAKLGKGAIDAFWKFYQIPGFGHNTGAFIPAWNAIGALDDWVSKGIEPGILVGADIIPATSGRTRPLCLYPLFPKYIGSGSLDRAENYTCAAN